MGLFWWGNTSIGSSRWKKITAKYLRARRCNKIILVSKPSVLEVISLVLLGWTSPLWGASTGKLFLSALKRFIKQYNQYISSLPLKNTFNGSPAFYSWKWCWKVHVFLSYMPKFYNGTSHCLQILDFSCWLCKNEKLLSPYKVIPDKLSDSCEVFKFLKTSLSLLWFYMARIVLFRGRCWKLKKKKRGKVIFTFRYKN